MSELSMDNKYDFAAISKESVEAAKKLEKDHRVEFEEYLKDFLSKIS